MKFLTIDRFEGGFAVCEDEDGKILNVDKTTIENSAKEGDIIFLSEGQGIFFVDKKKSEDRRRSIEERFRRLIK